MKFKKVRKLLSDSIRCLVGVDGNYVGRFTKEQLKEFNELYIKAIWTIPEHPQCICLDLVNKEVKNK